MSFLRGAGPWIVVRGTVDRPPSQSTARRGSWFLMFAAVAALAATIAAETLLRYLADTVTVVVLLVALLLASRRLRSRLWLGGLGQSRPVEDKPLHVTTFRLAVPEAEDAMGRMQWTTVRIISRQQADTSDLHGGDEVEVAGWRRPGGSVSASRVRSLRTASTIRSTFGASPAFAVGLAATSTVLALLFLWRQRWVFTDSGRATIGQQALTGVTQAITIVIIIAIGAFVVKKVILRR